MATSRTRVREHATGKCEVSSPPRGPEPAPPFRPRDGPGRSPPAAYHGGGRAAPETYDRPRRSPLPGARTMEPSHYYALHVAGAILLVAWTAQALAAPTKENKGRLITLTGVASLVTLAAGFGLMHTLGHEFTTWIFIKIGAWLAITVVAATIFRFTGLSYLYRVLVLAAIGAAVWAVYFRPGEIPV